VVSQAEQNEAKKEKAIKEEKQPKKRMTQNSVPFALARFQKSHVTVHQRNKKAQNIRNRDSRSDVTQ